MDIHEFNSIENLSPVSDLWRELLEQTPHASFFQTLDWLAVYWKHFGKGQRLRLLIVEEGGVTTGILPLVVRQERTKVGPLRFLTYPLDYWGSFYGPIGAHPDKVLSAGIEYLRSIPRDWDVLELRWVGSQSDECFRVEQLMRASGLTPVITTFDTTAVIALDGSWEGYLSQRSPKWRNNYRRWSRRIAELGDVTYLRHRPESGENNNPRWDLYDSCLMLAKASWQGSSQTGTTLTHPTVADFLRDVHAAAARCGALDLNLLLVNDQPIAFAYNYSLRGQVFGLRTGYHPDFKNSGAGNVLYTRVIEDSFRRGDWRYDMGPGSLDVKRQLWTETLPLHRLSCFASFSLRQQLMRFRRQMEARKQAIGSFD